MYKEHGKHIREAMFYTVSFFYREHSSAEYFKSRVVLSLSACASSAWIPHVCAWHMEMFVVILTVWSVCVCVCARVCIRVCAYVCVLAWLLFFSGNIE